MKKITAVLMALSIAISNTVALAASGDGGVSAGGTVPGTSSGSSTAVAAMKTKAFPTAEGGGMYTTGARGALENDKDMEVYHVTNLNDSGEGSFRDAVSKSNRIVVFDVSGMIDLASRVSISGDNITILGQTAPGDGICFRSNSIKVNGSNIILRYLRFRVGSKLADGSAAGTQDGFEIVDDVNDIIMDHCSISWGTDENLSAYAVKNMTVQWSIISEGLNNSVHAKGAHGYGGIWGGVNASFHHNIIASHMSRNPKIGTSETVAMTAGYKDNETVIDMWNNVIYNWGDKAGYGAENGANVNLVNNYYKPGPATPSGKRARIFELSPGNKYQAKWSGAIYADGNVIDDDSTVAKDIENAAAVNEENWQVDKRTGVYLDTDGVSIYEQLDSLGANSYINNMEEIETAEEAYEAVLEGAGARLPKLDIVDSRVIDNVANRTAPTGSNGSTGLVDEMTDAIPEGQEALYDDRGYPLWTSEVRADDYDTDKDGIADAWEDRMGLNKENPTDSTLIGPDGYTYLEIFAEEGITHNAGDVSLAVDGSMATVTSLTGGTYDVYVGDEKVDTVTIAPSSVPTGTTLISASYTDGVLTEVQTAEYEGGVVEYPTVEGDNVKHFMWDSLEGMKPVTVADGESSATANIVADTFGIFPVTAVATDRSVYSNVDYYITQKPVADSGNSNGEFTLVMDIYDIPTIVKNSYGLLTVNSGTSVELGAGCDENYEKVLYINGETTPLENAKIITVSSDGTQLTIKKGSSPLDLETVTSIPVTSDTVTYYFSDIYPEGEDNATNIGVRLITEKSTPTIEIANVEENQRLGFSEDIEVNVTPDGAAVEQISVSLNGTVIAQQEISITEAGTVSIPVAFSKIDEGTLEVACVDSNLCTATDSVNVTISADLTPWQIADIGVDENEPKTYVSVTNDYTYKINGPQGIIGGTSDEFGYVYQKFTGDNRIYYRSRMQKGEQFGIMVRKSLDADSESYFFGGEYVNGELAYNMKCRVAKAGDTVTGTTENLSRENLYFIAEKAGDKLNIYQTENSNTSIYTTKTLLHSIDISGLGDEYYMGFAVVYDRANNNPPDAGWVAIDNNSGDNNYTWNFDYGLDWCWQMQEANVLTPSWQDGKMVLETDSDYTGERYVFHEYLMDDSLTPQMSADVMLRGDAPAMNMYLQTGSASTAYKLTFDTDGKIKDANGSEIGEYKTGTEYNVKMAVDIDAVAMDTLCKVTITSADGTVVEDIAIPTDAYFRTQNNTEKKTAVTKAVYFEPVSGITGTYYIDNISVIGTEPSVKIEKTESWYTFEDVESENDTTLQAFTVNGTTSMSGDELSGEVMNVAENAIFRTGSKSIDGLSFTNKLRINNNKGKMTIPVKKGSEVTVYGASASSNEARSLFINGQEYSIKSACASTYTYTGEDGTIEIYGGSNIEIYGVRVVTQKIVD